MMCALSKFLHSVLGRNNGKADGVMLMDEVLATMVLLQYSPNRSSIVCDRQSGGTFNHERLRSSV